MSFLLPCISPGPCSRSALFLQFALARVFFWGKPGKPDVVTLQFENGVSDKGSKPMDYMEGHYLYLQCPHCETGNQKMLQQWHPFTISSAPDEPVLEVNIRVNPSKHSWTNQMATYLQLCASYTLACNHDFPTTCHVPGCEDLCQCLVTLVPASPLR